MNDAAGRRVGRAKEPNERYHELVGAGTSGLSVAFDLPTQMGSYRIALEIDSQERTVVGVNEYVLNEEEPYGPLPVATGSRPTSANASQRCARNGTTTPSGEPSMPFALRRAARTTSCLRWVRHWGCVPRWARAPTACATCGACTSHTTFSDT